MARHSKWHNIKHRKAAQDAKKGKMYAIHAKLIAMAAVSGGDPLKNSSLDMAIIKAKQDGVPAENIERAIKRGTGQDKNDTEILSIVYEGYAPGGVAVVVSVVTDNKNRTASNIRHIFSKYGGNMGEPGSVSWIFQKKGVLVFEKENTDISKLEELVFETDVEDMKEEDDIVKLIVAPESFGEVRKFFLNKGFTINESGTEFIPNNEVEVNEFDKVLKITKMIEALEEDEDVEDYAMNYNIDEKLQEEVDEFIEKNTFRT
ncbi:YebC/PmpR family DNA-binding transcriptional regulator [Candidatus Gracilibacteria bacterium]|nr:YebC/PmpR family DNA-binding transcriptional regulator [Candidatus Gracilibacteria bacterium]NUJ98539.1 YebC/PmpR family DNA-binding transcriptional regulator [Candidatus Gracilibacteria bacterium]